MPGRDENSWLQPAHMKLRLDSLAILVLGLTLVIPLVAQTVNTNPPTLSAGLVRGFPGHIANVPLALEHTGSVSGVQFDLAYPSAKLTAGALQTTVPLTNVVLRSRQMFPGNYRVLAYTKGRSVIPTNTFFGQLPFAVPTGAINGGGGRITFSNSLACSSQAAAVTPLALVNGAVVVLPVSVGEDGEVVFYLSVQSNRTYIIQASEDLIQWINLATNFAALDYII